jgi:hypothetical protein
MTRRRKALTLFLGLAALLLLFAVKMVVEVRRGEDIFWLAELWAPAAVLSIGLVTGIEFLMVPSHQAASPAQAQPKPVKKARRAKKAAK